MERYKKIADLIPTYNEGENIVRLLHKIKKKYKTIVVDDGSEDKTHQRVKKLCTHYLRNYQNIGYQKTIERGINFAIKKKYDGIITFDADEQVLTIFIAKVLVVKQLMTLKEVKIFLYATKDHLLVE